MDKLLTFCHITTFLKGPTYGLFLIHFTECFENGLHIYILRTFQSRKTTGIKIGNAICHYISQSFFGYCRQCNETEVIDFQERQSLSLAFYISPWPYNHRSLAREGKGESSLQMSRQEKCQVHIWQRYKRRHGAATAVTVKLSLQGLLHSLSLSFKY